MIPTPRRARTTLRPLRPYPTTIVWLLRACSSVVSSAAMSWVRAPSSRISRSATGCDEAISRGAASMDNTAAARNSWNVPSSSSPSGRPAAASTNENSPTWASPRPPRTAAVIERPIHRITRAAISTFSRITAAVTPPTRSGRSATAERSSNMPTEVKKMPLNTSRNGST